MFGERRRHKRETINRWAKLVANGGVAHDCLVVDISASGARLVCETEAPSSFTLMISGEPSIREECRVIWRNGAELGVEFASKEDHHQKTMEVIQAEARAAFNDPSSDNMNKTWRKSISANIELLNKSASSILRSPIRPKG